MLDEHLMGKTILDMDGRRTEVVNDIQVLESRGRAVLVHVDISFNGFLRRWGLAWLHVAKDVLISWRYVQPLSLEDAAATDRVSLSVTREQIKELPSEDLADALEELSEKEQQAVFSVLDTEKAAETLVEAEPRAQRQIIVQFAAGARPQYPGRNVGAAACRSFLGAAARRQITASSALAAGTGWARGSDSLETRSDRRRLDDHAMRGRR